MLEKLGAGVSLAAFAATLAYAAPAPNGAPRANPRLPTAVQWANMPASARAYVDKARELAGDDPDLQFDMGIFCKASGGASRADRATIGVPNSEPRLQPFPAPAVIVGLPAQQLADNLYWFGDTNVGAYLIAGRDGYVMYDTLHNAEEARDIVVAGMRRFGLDPAKLKYMVFSHYHYEHSGGGLYLQRTFGAVPIMGRDDWTLYYKEINTSLGTAPQLGADRTPMTRGPEMVDGMKLDLGDIQATVHQMTGHTPGSLGMIVPVREKGVTRNILLVASGSDVGNRNAFVGGFEHIWDKGIEAGVESVMQVHQNTNMNILARTKYVSEAYAAGRPPARNPLFYGKERTVRYLNIIRACTLARMDILGW